MSRHSLPSSSLPDRGRSGRDLSRHALADSVEDGTPVADAPAAARPVAIPPVTAPLVAIPLPRAPRDSRHAGGPVARHAADPAGTGDADRSGGHGAAQAGRHTADEPASGPIPVVSASAEPVTDSAATPTSGPVRAETPARAGRRHAAPQRHRRRAHAHAHGASRPGKGRRALAGLGGSRRTAAVLLTAAVVLVALPTAGSAAVDQCRWQVAAHDLLVSLDGQTDARSTQLRRALTRAGVGTELPAGCAGQAADQAAAPAPVTPAPRTPTPRTTAPKPAPTTTATLPKATAAPTTATAAPAPAPAAVGSGTTAAQAMGWGTPTKSDDFSAGLGQWGVYDGSGHAGNGRRTPSAVTTADGIMTMTGDTSGNTGGMAWGDGQKYGRWEARVRSSAGSYHPVMLLWPSAENWPIGGEVDWMEISDPARKVADTFLHYGADNNQVQGNVNVDATQWHNWAVEWTPQGITTYLDGKVWWSTKNTSILPPGPMHMTIQLDNFGGPNTATQMQVDWVKQYAP